MKRLLISMIIASCAGFILAQDVLALKNGERIENVTVSSITDSVIVYVKEGEETTLPRNSVDAILYADGHYEQIKPTFIGDSATIAMVEQQGFDANELQQATNSGDGTIVLLYQDKSYPKECRKAGKKVYYKVFKDLYNPALKEAKKSGLSNKEAMQKAIQKTFLEAVKASNEAVRECNEGM